MWTDRKRRRGADCGMLETDVRKKLCLRENSNGESFLGRFVSTPFGIGYVTSEINNKVGTRLAFGNAFLNKDQLIAIPLSRTMGVYKRFSCPQLSSCVDLIPQFIMALQSETEMPP